MKLQIENRNRGKQIRLALTIGDPCGIGPEIVVRYLTKAPVSFLNSLVVLGATNLLTDMFAKMSLPEPNWLNRRNEISGPLVDSHNNEISGPYFPGNVCKEGGIAALSAIEAAHKLCSIGVCHGMITGPIGKMAINLAGSPFSGHTDMLRSLNGVPNTRMAMVFGNLKVVMTTLHTAYRDVPDLLTFEAVYETIRMAHEAFSSIRRPFPKIAVGGLNPHAGEDGLFGDEEKKSILPAIREFQKINPTVEGPFPSDSLFKPEMRKKFDLFIAQTHDQGLSAIKALGSTRCVNVTLGLPYIRTSVGHGTAYDIAGKGIADAQGLANAVSLAFKLVRKNR